MPSESDLAVASQQVAGAKMNVAKQRERIARLRRAGYSTLEAERALGVFIRTLRVAKGFDVADSRIVQELEAGDLVVTADIPLAARTVALGAHVLGPTGRPFTPETIGMAVAMRDLKQHLRETGESRGFNASFTPKDRSQFLGELDRILRRALKSVTPD